ncbi:MAG: chemotaxis protein CheA, partial [Burkholderiales bacterium]
MSCRAIRPAEAFPGAIGSAGRLVVNILRSLGREGDVGAIETAIAGSATASSAQPLLDAIGAWLQLSEHNPSVPPPTMAEPRREAGAGAIRVDVDKVDAIVDLTGELLVVKNALAHLTQLAVEGKNIATLAAGLRTQTTRLDRHVTDLQRAVLDLRVLPLGRVFNRFPILVRETAAKLAKQVAFRTEGDDTVADKAVVEALFEPLLHVVRNAIDHGIETPDARVASGKPATADILMRAWREGDHVLVEVTDDGRGVDTAIVRKLAISRGVATASEVEALDDADAVDLIFAPGFTTATAVTELSGRGVGMNALRSAVGRIGGEVALTNMPGDGLVVRFTLPF